LSEVPHQLGSCRKLVLGKENRVVYLATEKKPL